MSRVVCTESGFALKEPSEVKSSCLESFWLIVKLLESSITVNAEEASDAQTTESAFDFLPRFLLIGKAPDGRNQRKGVRYVVALVHIKVDVNFHSVEAVVVVYS